jgi:hypothetical protein
MQAGDILLVEGTNKISKPLIVAQKLIYKSTKSSHVAFSLADGCFVHATGDGGVYLTFIKDELETCKENWRVIRNNKITEEEKDNFLRLGLYFLRQGYNKVFMGNGNDHSSFCSELVAKIYAKSGVVLFGGKKSSKISPAHFDKLADLEESWDDVTPEYRQLLQYIEKNEFQYRVVFNTVKGAMEKRAICNQGRGLVFDMMEKMSEQTGDPGLKNLAASSKEFLKENRELSFWDED